MTPIDVRIKYKSETGFAPTYGRYKLTHGNTQGGCNYKGGLTQEYAEWLESKGAQGKHFRGPEWKRWRYLKNTSNHTTYYKNDIIQYTKGYKEWMEEEYCKANTR